MNRNKHNDSRNITRAALDATADTRLDATLFRNILGRQLSALMDDIHTRISKDGSAESYILDPDICAKCVDPD